MPTAPPLHRGAGWKPYEAKRKESGKRHDERRGSSAERGYGYRWQQFRKRYLAEHPLCVMCEAKGRVVAATDVDHVIPHRGDSEAFWAGPFQGLCHPCHSRKTGRGG